MAQTQAPPPPPPAEPSALQSLITGFNTSLDRIRSLPSPPAPTVNDSVPTRTTDANLSDHDQHLLHLTLQIAHNLQHQHRWTGVRIHTRTRSRKDGEAARGASNRQKVLPRPMISGVPPRKLYVHPDEQVEFLTREEARKARKQTQAQQQQQQRPGQRSAEAEKKKKTPEQVELESEMNVKPNGGKGEDDADEDEADELKPEREWILPSHLRETWTLRRFAEVFDAIGHVPPTAEGTGSIAFEDIAAGDGMVDKLRKGRGADEWEDGAAEAREDIEEEEEEEVGKWRQMKRVVLATLDDDGTVVYYIVHDGVVKPRQN
ncbi:hypothetical protein LTS18_009834 [Coniosporium uncinatum]|uniref:Uncharacterized protein n=1 Tax=Coniosporium uncinatum TaxID=93489 RepID=A0ACC3D030_9PEZI|nr:hypothetical protein LTS18_009834 [Coniosporium uncinatum]